ncbi:MAG: hypothetical protein ABSH13_24140 [Candidatus Acidiferrum sp.]
MKQVCMVLAVVALCLAVPSLMLAQDNPILGTWKLNLEKSKFTGMPTPKSLTRSVSADGDSVKYSYEGTGADGAALAYGFTVKYDGKDYPVTGSTPPFGADQIAIKKLTSHKYSAVLKKGDKAVGGSTVTISADGKTATLIGKGTIDGKAASSTQVYDKQ